MNPLDDIIDRLGGPKLVAEMTGRKGRMIRNESGGARYTQRCEDINSTMETLNMTEKKSFMDGDKLIAIISDAASAGISLQVLFFFSPIAASVTIAITGIYLIC